MPHPRMVREGQRRGNTPFPETGTTIATNAIATSGRIPDVTLRHPGWGGTRNRAGRTSGALSSEQVELLIGAAQYALHIDLAFNRHITVNWQCAGIPDSKAAAMTGKLLKRASDWVHYMGGRFAAAWVRENGDTKGSHVHILAHIPIGLARRFFHMVMRWLRAIRASARHQRATIHTQRIGGTRKAAETSPEHYLENLWKVVSYVTKGSSPAIIAKHGLVHDFEPGGIVMGKRAGTTQNVGRAAWR